ncbi:MAG: alpha/beta fold hydrolase [Oscillochloris sp.]|nr:alpha/beta fold hydrolase [Oscillochloris sp.]
MSDATWIDPQLFPHPACELAVSGGTMRYVDVGKGAPLVFVHGTPTWSFLYRRLIAAHADQYRCVAPDNIGFGRSDKPVDWGYQFADHSRNLEQLINTLDLRDITLVVHDLGGPIGLRYALDHPERIRGLLIMNTVLWPMVGEFAPPAVGRMLAGPIGRWLYLRANFSARILLTQVYADRKKLTPQIHRHYRDAFATPDDRHGTFAFVQQIAAGTPALAELWARREILQRIPTTLVWGMRDPAFGPKYLARWREILPTAPVLEVADCGHFPQEEAPEQVSGALRQLLARTAPAAVLPA